MSAVQSPTPGMEVTPTIKLVRQLGKGGMGSVWVAEHTSLHTEVVVKFMSEQLVSNKEASARFSREAAAAARVKSPHVVQMLDHGISPQGTPYIVMELLVGEELSARLARVKRMPPTEVVAVVSQVAKALARAHTQGILHRDIKPENIFLCDVEGGEIFVKLLDFGIAKTPIEDGGPSSTTTGQVIGTPSYMSPEQLLGKEVDLRSDLWSLAVVAFEALTGERPFKATNVGALTLEVHNGPLPIPSLVNPALTPEIDVWFLQACRREPNERFASAKEFAVALSSAVYGAPPPGMNTGGSAASAPDVSSFGMRPSMASWSNEMPGGVAEPAVEVPPPKKPPSVALLAIVAGICSIVGAGLVLTLVTRSKPDPTPAVGSAVSASRGTTTDPATAPSATASTTPAPSSEGSTKDAGTTEPVVTAPPEGTTPATKSTGARKTTTGHKSKHKADNFDIK